MEKRDFVTDKPSRPKTRHHALSETERATTTHEIRNKIRQEQGTTNAIARKFNIDWTTAKKWKNRNSIEEQAMGNGRANSSLNLMQ